ncbi:MFS transporter [uncultured Williamsia sp.]|uniref:MFS transporter n=1 Tax=uncultured Williamsia sp. TaxID=259311 RepID=UPI00260385D0|nr:MFS transporter [uncultured Williamsia sp.]
MTADTVEARRRFDRRLLAPMMIGSILNPINSSIIAIALVPIAVALGAPASQTVWLVSGLYLATAVGQPVMGRLIDVHGPRRLYLVGALCTVGAGVLGVVAPDLWVLVLARVLLGIGTCAAYPASMYLIRMEGERTGTTSPAGVLTALSVTTQTIAVIGPTLGGLLIGLGGWRATFAINIPLGLAILVLGLLFLPRSVPVPDGPRARSDWVGVALFTAMVLSLLVFLMDLSVDRLWLPVVTVVVGAAFVMRERRVAHPFIDVAVFVGNRPLVVTYVRAVLAATVSYSYLYGYTQWLQETRGLSATAAGLVLLPTFAVGIVVSVTTGRRPQIRRKLLVGAVAQMAAAALILSTWTDAPLWYLVVTAAVTGVPQGLINLAVQNTLYHQADPERMGASSGLLRTFMYSGAMLASAASGAFFGARATTSGVHELAVFMLVVAAALAVLTVVDRSLRAVDAAAQG